MVSAEKSTGLFFSVFSDGSFFLSSPQLKIKKESKSPSVRDKTPQKQFIEMPDEPPLIPCGQIREIAEPNLISEAETPTNF